jgi:hypothetical protein
MNTIQTEEEKKEYQGLNMIEAIGSDLREYVDLRIRMWENSLEESNLHLIDKAGRIMRNAIYEMIKTTPAVYLKPPFAMPAKVVEIATFYNTTIEPNVQVKALNGEFCNILALIAVDLREYLEYKIYHWELCLTHDNEPLEKAARFCRHAIWNIVLENRPIYIESKFSMPAKIQTLAQGLAYDQVKKAY